jgi:hypothetical protein
MSLPGSFPNCFAMTDWECCCRACLSFPSSGCSWSCWGAARKRSGGGAMPCRCSSRDTASGQETLSWDSYGLCGTSHCGSSQRRTRCICRLRPLCLATSACRSSSPGSSRRQMADPAPHSSRTARPMHSYPFFRPSSRRPVSCRSVSGSTKR